MCACTLNVCMYMIMWTHVAFAFERVRRSRQRCGLGLGLAPQQDVLAALGAPMDGKARKPAAAAVLASLEAGDAAAGHGTFSDALHQP